MAVTVSSNNRVSFPSQAVDRNPTPGAKWFSLQDNALDGSFKLMPDTETNQALNKTVTIGMGTTETSSLSKPIGLITDGDITSANYYGLNGGLGNVIVDLGQLLGIETLTIWHYYADSRTYHSTKTEVSVDGQNWDVIFDSAVSGEYVETASGHTIDTAGRSFRYIRDWLNGSNMNGSNHWVEIQAVGASEVGWWGDELSNTDGSFAHPQTMTETFGVEEDIAFQENWDTNPYPVTATTVNSVDGVLDVTSTSGDPMISMYELGSFDPNKYRWIEMRYRIVNGVGTNCELFFTNTQYTTANSANHVYGGSLIADGEWHSTFLDGWSNANWKTQGNITGWRLDWAMTSGVEMQIDFVRLIADALPVQSIPTLRLAGDSELDEYPVDFTAEVYSGTSLIHTEVVMGNTSSEWSKALASVLDATKIEYSITKVNKANRTVKVVEASQLFQRATSDNVVLTSTAATTAGVSVTGSDVLTLTASETSDVPQITAVTSDTLTLIAGENTPGIVASFGSGEGLMLVAAESPEMTVEFTNSDTLVIDQGIEAEEITVSFSSSDDLEIVAAADSSNMTNIHTVMDESFRAIYGKVEITYTDPFLDEQITVTASSTARGTDPNETADTEDTPDAKWFSLQNNVLDGSFSVMPSSGENTSIGWWGTEISNADGSLSTPETLTVEFSARGVYDLKVTGDDKLGEYPVDFDIIMYDVNGAALHTESVVDNTICHWKKSLDAVIVGVTSMELKIYKLNEANRTAKIVEFYTALVEVYEGEELISIDALEEQIFDDMTLPIGNVSSNELTVVLSNENHKFDPSNAASPLYGWLKKNRRIKAWLGAEVVPGVVEWYQLGVFWTKEWKAPQSELFAQVTALDRLELLRTTTYENSQVMTDGNLYDAAVQVLQDAGLTEDDYVIDPALQNIIVPYIWFDRVSHRQAITQIAEAAIGRVYCDRQGRVVVTPFQTTDMPIYYFDYDKSVIDADRPIALSEQTNQVEITSSPRNVDTVQDVYTSFDTITLDPGETFTETITFNSIPVISPAAPTITADASITVQSYETYAWGMKITYINSSATTPGTITQVDVQGAPLVAVGKRIAIVKDDQLIRDNGKQAYTLENDFIQSYQRATQVAQDIFDAYSSPRHTAQLQTRGNIALQLGDKVGIPRPKGGWDDFYLTRQTLTWEGSLISQVEAQVV